MLAQDVRLNLEYNPSNKNIYVANFNSGEVSVIDRSTNTVTTTLDVGDSPIAMEYHQSNEYNKAV